MTFEYAFREKLKVIPDPGRKERRILAVLDMEPSKRKARILSRMEGYARVTMEYNGQDWAGADWSKIATVIQVIAAILTILMLL